MSISVLPAAFLLSVSLASLIFVSPPSWTRIRVFQSAFMSHILSDKGRVPQQEVDYDRDSGLRVVFQLQRDDGPVVMF